MEEAPMVEFVVPRESSDEHTYAVVKAQIFNEDLAIPRKFLKALKAGVTDWMKRYKQGTDAWEESRYDFNVGDLSLYQKEVDLVRALREQGIELVDVQTFVGITHNWRFDTILANSAELEV